MHTTALSPFAPSDEPSETIGPGRKHNLQISHEYVALSPDQYPFTYLFSCLHSVAQEIEQRHYVIRLAVLQLAELYLPDVLVHAQVINQDMLCIASEQEGFSLQSLHQACLHSEALHNMMVRYPLLYPVLPFEHLQEAIP